MNPNGQGHGVLDPFFSSETANHSERLHRWWKRSKGVAGLYLVTERWHHDHVRLEIGLDKQTHDMPFRATMRRATKLTEKVSSNSANPAATKPDRSSGVASPNRIAISAAIEPAPDSST